MNVYNYDLSGKISFLNAKTYNKPQKFFYLFEFPVYNKI